MNREEIIKKLRTQQSALSGFKIKSLELFGSFARGEAGADSDIDFIVDFQGSTTFDQYMGLKIFLEDLFHRSVDLVTRRGIRPEIAPYIKQEAQRVA
jgi:predicted nucleotidyltransferase